MAWLTLELGEFCDKHGNVGDPDRRVSHQFLPQNGAKGLRDTSQSSKKVGPGVLQEEGGGRQQP